MKRPLNEGGPSHDDEYDSDLPATLLFDEARLAVAGFLTGYSAATRQSYAADLRQFFAWCN